MEKHTCNILKTLEKVGPGGPLTSKCKPINGLDVENEILSQKKTNKQNRKQNKKNKETNIKKNH